MLVVTAPSINGVSTTPDDVADVPITPCTNSGTYVIVPNMAMPTRHMQDTPTASGGSLRAVRLGIASRTTSSAIPPTGRLIVKIQRQLELSTMKPPTVGPAIEEAAKVAPISPW